MPLGGCLRPRAGAGERLRNAGFIELAQGTEPLDLRQGDLWLGGLVGNLLQVRQDQSERVVEASQATMLNGGIGKKPREDLQRRAKDVAGFSEEVIASSIAVRLSEHWITQAPRRDCGPECGGGVDRPIGHGFVPFPSGLAEDPRGCLRIGLDATCELRELDVVNVKVREYVKSLT